MAVKTVLSVSGWSVVTVVLFVLLIVLAVWGRVISIALNTTTSLHWTPEWRWAYNRTAGRTLGRKDMKTIVTLILFGLLVSVATLWAQTSQKDQRTIQQLEARLKTLEDRVAALEKTKETKYITLPSSQLPPASTPKPDWRPFEFNGQTYYYVPLKQDETRK